MERKGAGAAEGTRTPDPIITNDVLYQLSYCGPREATSYKTRRPRATVMWRPAARAARLGRATSRRGGAQGGAGSARRGRVRASAAAAAASTAATRVSIAKVSRIAAERTAGATSAAPAKPDDAPVAER